MPSRAQVIGPAKQWDKTYGGNGQDNLKVILETKDGGFLFAGYSSSGVAGTQTQPSLGKDDYWIVKTDANGSVQWNKRFGDDDIDRLHDALQTADGGYVLAGASRLSGGWSGSDKSQRSEGGWVIKLSSAGVKQWDISLPACTTDDCAQAIAETIDGGFLIGGGMGTYIVWKISDLGQLEWLREYQSPGWSTLREIHRTADNGFMLAGSTSGSVGYDKTVPARGGNDFWLVKIDVFGQKEGDWAFGGPGHDFLEACQPTTDGGWLLGGISYSGVGGDKTQASQGKADYWVVKINSTGKLQWERRFGGSEDDELYAIQALPDGALIGGSSWSPVSGNRTQSNRGYNDYWVLRLDAQGNQLWDQRYGSNDIDKLETMLVTRDGGCLLGGSSSGSFYEKTAFNYGGLVNFWVVKLAPFLPLSTTKAARHTTIHVAPNPASDQVSFTLPAQLGQRAFLATLLDAVGRPVRQVKYQAAQETTTASLPVRGLPAGVYFLQLLADNEVLTTQRVEVK